MNYTEIIDSYLKQDFDAKLVIEDIAALNMTPGKVTVSVRCLASGKTGTAEFSVE
jgi:hypothetical protein